MINVFKPIKRSLRVDMRGKVFSVMTYYERLPNFCYFCGRMGHLIRDCFDNDVGLMDESKLHFGSWLSSWSWKNKGGKFSKEEGENGDLSDGSNQTVSKKNLEKMGVRTEIDDSSLKDSAISFQGGTYLIGVNAAEWVVFDKLKYGCFVGNQSTEGRSVETGHSVVMDQKVAKADAEEISSPKQRKWKRLACARGGFLEIRECGHSAGKMVMLFEEDRGLDSKQIFKD
ncbi:hypothetical protein ACOSQ2_014619 [Xanthoceras sorbifolium]